MDTRNLASLGIIPIALTVAPVYAVDYLNVPQAQKILFPEAVLFLENPVNLNKKQKKAIKKLAGVRQRWDTQKVWRAQTADKFLGWFIVDDVVGKHEFITYAAALSPEGEVLGVEIMSYRETHGGEIREADWRDFLKGKTLVDPFKLDKDVPNISGATLSCRNVMDGVKRLLALQQVVLNNE